MTQTAMLAARLIQMIEGLRLSAYKDTGGVWTVGFGHTLTAKEGMVITPDKAAELFEQDSSPLIKLVEKKKAFEAAALVSFGFNCGIGALKRVLDGSIQVTADGFLAPSGSELVQYGIRDKKGTMLAGLVARRRLEAGLIMVSRAS